MHESTTRPTADFSRERRRLVTRLIRRSGVLADPRLTDDAKVLYVVCALVADDGGVGRTDALTEAMQDPSIVQVARTIMAQAVA